MKKREKKFTAHSFNISYFIYCTSFLCFGTKSIHKRPKRRKLRNQQKNDFFCFADESADVLLKGNLLVVCFMGECGIRFIGGFINVIFVKL